MNTENVVKHLRCSGAPTGLSPISGCGICWSALGLRAFAALIAAFGLLMLELSAYFALVQIWSAISAAAILGAANFVIAAVLFVIAARPPAGRELELATEIHGSASTHCKSRLGRCNRSSPESSTIRSTAFCLC